MNRIFNLLLSLIFLFSVCIKLYGQELPPIEKFSPEDYGGDNQNWMISQASNKFIYVANNEGLLEFNGSQWNMYLSPNKTVIRSVKVVDDKIYTGCYMEFGYWEKNSLGELQYQSLVSSLPQKMIEDENIWNIITYNEWVLFQSHNRIYFYNTNTNTFTIINSKKTITKLFNIQNTIYYIVTNEGIYKIEEGQSKLVTGEKVLNEDIVVNIFPADNALLIQTRKSGFYILKDNVLSAWEIPASNTLRKISVFNSVQLQDKSFVLGTVSNGIIYLNKEGIIEYQIDQSSGLIDNTALSLFEDSDNNIWVGLDNGISCINIKSSVRIFNDAKGYLGTIYASTIFDNNLYLGSNQGLFYRELGSNEPFKFIEGTAGQVYSLFVYNNDLLCGHHYGTFIIKGDKAISIYSQQGTWNFRPIPNKENELLQGNYGGLNIIAKDQGTWKLKNKVEGFDNSVRYFEILDNNEVWISHGYKGVFKLELNKNLDSVITIFKEPDLALGKNSSLIKFKDHLLYAFDDGVYRYYPSQKKFLKDTILSTIVLDETYLSGKLVVDETKKLWAFTKENISYVSIDNLTNQFKINKISIPAKLRKGMVGYETISFLGKNVFLLGTANGYITLNLSTIDLDNNNYNIYLNAITLKNRESESFKIDIDTPGEVIYTNNSLVFNYSVPEYDKFQIVKYQYKLIGKYNQWSEWTTRSELAFENLPFGNYTLQVRAKIGNELINNTINYDFEVMRPWYLSNLSVLSYFFILFAITLIIHRAYKKYYQKQLEHKQMESEQLIIRIKNEKLNQAIESKNRELAISTMSIIKKNELLASIKKELKSSNQNSKNESVIKLVDKNLNTSKDWKFFEEAFNNVDKDFLNKVKKMYPDLTPNDLRFCAYLRLNLSSKEIAPLLNISVRSVETKRYRLRKRMNLMHDDSLVNHILEI